MVAILTALIPLALKLVDLYLDKIVKDKKAKKRFLEFVDSISDRHAKAAVRLSKESQRQLDELRQKKST